MSHLQLNVFRTRPLLVGQIRMSTCTNVSFLLTGGPLYVVIHSIFKQIASVTKTVVRILFFPIFSKRKACDRATPTSFVEIMLPHSCVACITLECSAECSCVLLLSKDTLTCASMPANSCNPNISCTWYTGIGTFLILLHVAGHFEATNWLLQKAKRRWVRASRVTSQCNKLKDALS